MGMDTTLNNVLSTVPLVQHSSSAPYSIAKRTTILPTGIANINTKIPIKSDGKAVLVITCATNIGINSIFINKKGYICLYLNN